MLKTVTEAKREKDAFGIGICDRLTQASIQTVKKKNLTRTENYMIVK